MLALRPYPHTPILSPTWGAKLLVMLTLGLWKVAERSSKSLHEVPQTGEKELAPLALKSLTSLVMVAVGAVLNSAGRFKKQPGRKTACCREANPVQNLC